MRQEYYAHTSSSRENEKLLDHLLLTAKLRIKLMQESSMEKQELLQTF